MSVLARAWGMCIARFNARAISRWVAIQPCCFYRGPIYHRWMRCNDGLKLSALASTLTVIANMLVAAGPDPVLTLTGDGPKPIRQMHEAKEYT